MDEKIFWKDGFEGRAKGGLYYRAFDLVKFIEGVVEKEMRTQVVGIRFSGNNIELIIEDNETSEYDVTTSE